MIMMKLKGLVGQASIHIFPEKSVSGGNLMRKGECDSRSSSKTFISTVGRLFQLKVFLRLTEIVTFVVLLLRRDQISAPRPKSPQNCLF